MTQPVADVIRGLDAARFAAAVGEVPSSRAIGLGYLALRDVTAAAEELVAALAEWDAAAFPTVATAARIDLALHNLRAVLDGSPSTERHPA